MKIIKYILLVIPFLLISCGAKDKLNFEDGYLPTGHYQSIDGSKLFFSIGHYYKGANRIVDYKFFISTPDSILSSFHVLEDIEINGEEKSRTFKTNLNTYIKLVLTDEHNDYKGDYDLEIYGPSTTLSSLENGYIFYEKYLQEETPFSDEILYDK